MPPLSTCLCIASIRSWTIATRGPEALVGRFRGEADPVFVRPDALWITPQLAAVRLPDPKFTNGHRRGTALCRRYPIM